MLHFLIIVTYLWKSRQELKQGRNLEAATQADTMEEHCLLVFSAQFLICLSTTRIRGRIMHNRATLPYQSLNQKMPHNLATALSY